MSDVWKEFNIPPFTFCINQAFGETFDSGWMTLSGHYLLYASAGAFRLEVGNVRWLLPPQRAAWVAAGVPLRLHAEAEGTTGSVLFAEGSIPPLDFTSRVFAVSTLAREMLLYAVRWGPERESKEEAAANFFRTLATVCRELADSPDEFWLPCAQSAELAQALDYTLAHLAEKLTFAQVASVANVSERTLARRFAEEAGMTWHQFLQRARMIRAMELLAKRDAKIIEIAFQVGYGSVSAFNHAFRKFTGETPSSYRQRFERK